MNYYNKLPSWLYQGTGSWSGSRSGAGSRSGSWFMSECGENDRYKSETGKSNK